MANFDDEYPGLFDNAYRVAFRVLMDREAAADVAQETMVRALIRWPRVQSHGRPWVCRTAGNLALDIVRRNGRPLRGSGGSERPPDEVGQAVEVLHAIRRLPRRQREVVFLRHIAGLSERDVAGLLGCSAGTVKTHNARGLKALGLAFEEEDHVAADD